jgi:hypothetical protein
MRRSLLQKHALRHPVFATRSAAFCTDAPRTRRSNRNPGISARQHQARAIFVRLGAKPADVSVGQTRKSSWPTPTSALPPKADSSRTSLEVRFVPEAEVSANSFDCAVRPSLKSLHDIVSALASVGLMTMLIPGSENKFGDDPRKNAGCLVTRHEQSPVASGCGVVNRLSHFRDTPNQFFSVKGKKSAVPMNRRKPQSPPLHFITKFFGILLHAVACKAILAAELAIGLHLIANVFVKSQKRLVF